MANDFQVLSNGVKLLGETLVTPGASLVLDGRIGSGLVHGALGLAATAILGPVAPIARILLSINSYSQSVTDRNIWEFRGTPDEPEPDRRRAPAAAAPAARSST
jgi:hypothetical protein